MNRRDIFVAAVCAAACCAIARTPDGQLGPLLMPNDARPAVAAQGGTFTVVSRTQGELSLVMGESRVSLAATWSPNPDGSFTATCTAPVDAAPGLYGIELQGDAPDRTVRAVSILAEMPERYTVACVAFSADERPDADNVPRAIDTINQSGAALVFVFLDTPEAVAPALKSFETCALPTWIISSGAPAALAPWLGRTSDAISFGKDSFLVLDSARDGMNDDLGAFPARLSAWRRANKSARWAVVVAPEFRPPSIRNELTLFVDDSIHALVVGPAKDAAIPSQIQWAGWFDAIPVYPVQPGAPRLFEASHSRLGPARFTGGAELAVP